MYRIIYKNIKLVYNTIHKRPIVEVRFLNEAISRLLSRTSVAAKKTRKTALSPEALNHAKRLG